MPERGRGPAAGAAGGAVWAERGGGGPGVRSPRPRGAHPPATRTLCRRGALRVGARVVFSAWCSAPPWPPGQGHHTLSAPLTTGPGSRTSTALRVEPPDLSTLRSVPANGLGKPEWAGERRHLYPGPNLRPQPASCPRESLGPNRQHCPRPCTSLTSETLCPAPSHPMLTKTGPLVLQTLPSALTVPLGPCP